MKPIPTIEELKDAALAFWGRHDLYPDSISAPLFAAIEERDAEIERLRQEVETIKDHTEAATIKKLFVSTQPEPAKPETFEAHGKTWTRHNPGDPMPVDGETKIHVISDDFKTLGQGRARELPWSIYSSIIGYRLADEAKADKSESCEHCGGNNIRHTGCPRCGAPICCDDCCKRATQELANPDPYAHLREAEAQGEVIQFNYGPSGTPKWRDLPRPRYSHRPEIYRVKPWTLPPPPEGKQWHRVDGWTENMLPEGWRPLLLGEIRRLGDQAEMPRGWQNTKLDGFAAHMKSRHTRTRRPLPEPEVWVDLGPSDIPPGSVIKADEETQAQVLRVGLRSVYILGQRGTPYDIDFEELGEAWQINRSLSAGKWDPNAWEDCKKLKV